MRSQFDHVIGSEKVDSSIGTMKAQAVVKCGSNWDWTTQQSWPAYGETNFTEAQEAPGYKKLHISIDMNDFKDSKGNAKTIKDIIPLYAVIPCLAGDTSTYAGDIYLDNLVVTAYNKGTEEPPVIVKKFEADGKVGATQETLGYWESADGKKIYNFSGYTPGETAGNVVERIMPGQDLNYLYTAYLDMIADYAKAVENDSILFYSVLFTRIPEAGSGGVQHFAMKQPTLIYSVIR